MRTKSTLAQLRLLPARVRFLSERFLSHIQEAPLDKVRSHAEPEQLRPARIGTRGAGKARIRHHCLKALLLSSAFLWACSTVPPKPVHSGAQARSSVSRIPNSARGNSNDVAMRALGLVGTPYRSAGSDPAIGFDCSGLVVFVYRDAAGVALPRGTVDQFALNAPSPSAKAMRTGDLVFFATGKGGVSHVGIYVGEGRFVHAPNHGGRVRLDRLDDRYWSPRYRGARRVL